MKATAKKNLEAKEREKQALERKIDMLNLRLCGLEKDIKVKQSREFDLET